ncbi:MAG: hypothetical protein DRP55_03625 [Spirochaetes bacterium]|nr:MAG: hypothetical protein DRP55_03625 [Spirochaetota bacterium]
MSFFKNHGVLVTGGGRGIGRAIALAFATEGADVFITSRTEKELKCVTDEINKLNVKGGYYVCDISDPRQVEKMSFEAINFLGKVDILINNAGIFLMSEAKDTSINEWQMVINVNLNGMFYCTHFILPGMIERRYGTIINISSMAGKKPYLKQSAYVASKFGIVGFSKTLAGELKPYNIKVHVICPGGVDTTLVRQHNFPPGSTIKPEEIADIAVFLAKQRKEITIDEVMVRRYSSDPY